MLKHCQTHPGITTFKLTDPWCIFCDSNLLPRPPLWSGRQRISRNNRSLTYLCPVFSLLWSHLCARVPLRSVQWEWTCTKSHTSGFPGGRSVRWGWWENSPTAHCCPRSTAVYNLWKTRGSHVNVTCFPSNVCTVCRVSSQNCTSSEENNWAPGHWIPAGRSAVMTYWLWDI